MSTLRLFVSVCLFLITGVTAAQSTHWATSDQINIYNTNSGGVVVGTGVSTPSARLNIFSNTVHHLTLFSNNPTSWNLTNFNAGYFGIMKTGAASPALTILDDGKVGIGTTAPATALAVFSGTGSQLRLLGSGSTAWDLLNSSSGSFSVTKVGSATPSLTILNGGNVGIGTATPAAALEVHASLNGVAMRAVDPSAMAQGQGAGIELVGRYTSTEYSTFGTIRASKLTTLSGDRGGKILLQIPDSTGALSEVATFQTGSVNFNGVVTGTTIRANYQDVAEWVVSEETLVDGTVVIIDPGKTDQVIASAEAYDTRVAGVVSPQPGLLLGIPGEGKVKVATTGRVRVRVDADPGAIAIGDLLVTSGKSGMAMKSEPMDINGRRFHQPGTIIGKALEPLKRGSAEILVLLSLQ